MLKNTASQVVGFFMVDSTDGETGITIGTPTVYITKDGGTQATGGGTSTHEGNGQWTYAPTQAETNADHVFFTMKLSGAITQSLNVYPGTIASLATQASVDTIDGIVDSILIDTAEIGAAGAGLTTLATQASVDVIDGNVDAILVDTGTTIPASLTTIDNEIAAIDGIVDAILIDTAEIGAAGAGLTALATQVSVDTIDGIVDSILVDTAEIGTAGAGLTALATQTSVNTIDGIVDAILVDTGTTIPASLTTIDDEIATIDANVDAILIDTAEIGAAGAGLTALATQASVDVIDTNVDSILVDTAEIGAAGAGLTALATQASVDTIDGIVDDILIDTAEIGAAGAGLTALATQASVDTIDSNVDAILVDTAEIGAAGSGLTALATQASVDTIDSNVDAILVDTAEIGAAGSGLTALATQASVDTIDSVVDGIKAVTDNLPSSGALTNLPVDVVKVLGGALAETTSGRIVANFNTFFDNGDSNSTKTQDDIGGGTVSGTVDANVVQIKGSGLTETTAGRLAANISTVFDNADAATTKTADDIGTATVSGTVNANLTQVLGTAVTETTSGRLAQNASVFFDNDDGASTKTQDDIGSALVTGTVNANVTQVKGTALTETSTGNLADNISQFYDLDTTTTKTVDDVDQATVTGTVNANVTQFLGTTIAETTAGRIAANFDEFFDNDDAASAVTLQTIQDIDDNFASVAGSGARTITVNVKDTAGTPANLENARVRLTEGVNTFVVDTDASGNAVFALDDATYSYAIYKAGYTSETGTIVVTADATVNKDIAQSSITPSSGSDTSTGVLVCYDENYAPESGVTFSMQMTAGPGVAGDSLDTTVRTATSAATTGLVQFTNLVRGATYQLWRSTFTSSSVFGSIATANAKVTVVVPDAASFNLPEVLGTDA